MLWWTNTKYLHFNITKSHNSFVKVWIKLDWQNIIVNLRTVGLYFVSRNIQIISFVWEDMQTKYSKKHYFRFIAKLIFRHAQRDFETSSTSKKCKEGWVEGLGGGRGGWGIHWRRRWRSLRIKSSFYYEIIRHIRHYI